MILCFGNEICKSKYLLSLKSLHPKYKSNLNCYLKRACSGFQKKSQKCTRTFKSRKSCLLLSSSKLKMKKYCCLTLPRCNCLLSSDLGKLNRKERGYRKNLPNEPPSLLLKSLTLFLSLARKIRFLGRGAHPLQEE